MFYFTFSSAISAWVSVQSFPRWCCMQLTSFASAPLLSLVPVPWLVSKALATVKMGKALATVRMGKALLAAAEEKALSGAAGWSCLSMDLWRRLSTDLYFASYICNLEVWKINFSLAFAEVSCQLRSSEFLSPFVIGRSTCKKWALCSPFAYSLISSVISWNLSTFCFLWNVNWITGI